MYDRLYQVGHGSGSGPREDGTGERFERALET